MSELLTQQIQKLPKVELHSHLEGCIQPQLVRAIAKRNDITLKELRRVHTAAASASDCQAQRHHP